MTAKPDKIRNFCIIAHIDHGKSTLADRFLQLTGTIEERKMKEQLLDQMDLERERGITIKLQPVRMEYRGYVLNLIDTPGHVDFQYEVSRSLAAVEGAVLLVDATKGVQAQTVANLYLAIEQGLEIIPVVNKIDLPNAEPEKVKEEIVSLLGCAEEEVLFASGKSGRGVKEVLEAILARVPSPRGARDGRPRALIFDSVYDTYKGVVAYVRVMDGAFTAEDEIELLAAGSHGQVMEVGVFKPDFQPRKKLLAGEIGYIATGLKTVADCRVGDTIGLRAFSGQTEALAGYRRVQPMVYAELYPAEGEDYTVLREALEKLTLNDAALTFEPESNPALGRGFRLGFLGLLHLEIIQSRLEREFSLRPTLTAPSVVYRVYLTGRTEPLSVYSPVKWPDPSQIDHIREPFVKLEIIVSAEYLGAVMELMGKTRAVYRNTDYLEAERVLLVFEAPLSEVITNLHDRLKSVSAGYGSMSYEPLDWRESDLVKLDILVAGEKVDAFSRIVPREAAAREGKAIVSKLKEIIPRQNFAVALQAAVGGKILARETISAFRKDVTAKLYGGDVTRKRKLL
ncbi:MAG TPA: elongation factor 4, partial [Candidatus Moranbacteria bacterium]|nr:elongation factor 4 [Candidatus Moranbacteria bacterium]